MIMDVLGDPKARGWHFCGPDALEFDVVNFNNWHELDLPEEDDPGNFRAIAAGDDRFIGDPDIVRCHSNRNPHWAHISAAPARYPEPPFLLTDNPAHRLVYHGEAALLPSKTMIHAMR